MNVPSECGDCPQAPAAKGFALHSGALPPKSGICLLLESPGPDEPVFLVKDLVDGPAELRRRRKQYPELEEKWIRIGAPVVGRAGSVLWSWLLAPLGLQRSDVAIFNSLACYPGKGPDGTFVYPKGNVRKRAEATCAQTWMQPLLEWDPTVSVVAMHPSAISRDVTPLPVVLRAVERAKEFASKGERVLLLMGGKAAKHWMGYGENTTRWCGHWQRETEFTRRERRERWEENRGLSMVKAKREKKLTLRGALEFLLSKFVAVDGSDPEPASYVFNGGDISGVMYQEMVALCTPKTKKLKEEAPIV